LEVALRRSHPADGPSTQQLETALVEAFNEAVRQVMERNAERLAARWRLTASARPPGRTREKPSNPLSIRGRPRVGAAGACRAARSGHGQCSGRALGSTLTDEQIAANQAAGEPLFRIRV
jgi:hypothetical protein